jgi:hypothetical protein
MASDAKKKKMREIESRMKVLRRREATRKAEAEKYEKEQDKKLARILEEGPNRPIKNPATIEAEKSLMVKRNAKMLKALEQKWIEEQKKRTDLNEALEKEGFVSIEQKLEHLKKVSMEMSAANAQAGQEPLIDVGMLDAPKEEKID